MTVPALPYAIRSHVERELFNYPLTVKAIAERRKHLIEGGDGRDPLDPDLPRRGSAVWSDPTYYAGTALAEDRRLRELERIVAAIDDVVRHPALPVEARRIIEAWYWHAERIEDIIAEVGVSRATLQRYRTATLAAIAARLGWIA